MPKKTIVNTAQKPMESAVLVESKNLPKQRIGQHIEHPIEGLICFALYSASTAINKAYQPHLKLLGLTYPQYIALSALWESDTDLSVGMLCEKLMTQTNTLTPILQRLEVQNLVIRQKSEDDGRQVNIKLTEKGLQMRMHQSNVTKCVVRDTGLPTEELDALTKTISKMRDNLIKAQGQN